MDESWSPRGCASAFSDEGDLFWPSFILRGSDEDLTKAPPTQPFTYLAEHHQTPNMQRYLDSKERSSLVDTPLQSSEQTPHWQPGSSSSGQAYYDHNIDFKTHSRKHSSNCNWDGDRPSLDHNPSLCSDHSMLSPRTSEDCLDFDQPFPRQFYCPTSTYTPGYVSGYNPSYPTGYDLIRSFGDYAPHLQVDSAYHSPRLGGVAPRDLQQQSDIDDEEHGERGHAQDKKCQPDFGSSPTASRLFHPSPQGIRAAEDTCVHEEIDPSLADQNHNQSDDSDYRPSKKAKRTHARQPSNSSAHPRNCTQTPTTRSRVYSKSTKSPSKPPNTHRITLRTPTHPCPHCPHLSATPSSQQKHLLTHTRPYLCIFSPYGCISTFSSKNEWKRHINTQHLRLGVWRCDIGACAPLPRRRRGADGDVEDGCTYNDFNRKDLFVQHLRRMHSPSLTGEGETETWNRTMEYALDRCWREIRKAPPARACGICRRKRVVMVFEGSTAWDSWLEHVGGHLKDAGRGQPVVSGERGFLDDDEEMRAWFVDEGLLIWMETGWRTVGLKGDRGGRVKAEVVVDGDEDADADGEDE